MTRARTLWGKVVLNGNNSQELIDKDMARAARDVQMPAKTKYMAMQIGAACVLLLWAISECLNNEQSGAKIWNDPTFAIFMCIGDFLLLQLMWGISMYVWKKSGIDFNQLLSLQHTELAESKTPALLPINSVAQLSIVFLVVFIVFNKLVRWSMNGYFTIAYAHVVPVLLCIFILCKAFFPFDSRKKWLAMFGRVLLAPGFSVIFRDGYIGDILTSLVRVLVPCAFSLMYLCISIYAWLFNDLQWTISTSDDWWTHNSAFHYILIPILTIYPLWIRLVQCLRRSVETGHRWPHMVNGLKYTSAIVVISLATFQPSVRQNSLWILSFIGATVFQFLWDLFQDWGMVSVSVPANGNVFNATIELRSKRLLGPAWLYVTVMLFNLVLRFAWTLTLLPSPEPEDGFSFYAVVVSHIGPIVAAAEIVRRMIWGFYRLEWEQLEILQKINLVKPNGNVVDGMSKVSKVMYSILFHSSLMMFFFFTADYYKRLRQCR
ncbi:hypothetical protein EON65_05450 [archaeon]|nr:MAG: hypothetical protein EON65_05450 [archaeon]